jgi:hypothetical protein
VYIARARSASNPSDRWFRLDEPTRTNKAANLYCAVRLPVAYLEQKSTFDNSLQQILPMLKINLLEKGDLYTLLCECDSSAVPAATRLEVHACRVA